MNGNDETWGGHRGSGDPGYDQHYQDPPYAQGGGFDDRYYQDQQQAPQQDPRGSEWDYSTHHDEYQTGGGKRSNGFLIFAVAALFAALIGVGFAIYTVLTNGGDTTDNATETAGTVSDTSGGTLAEGAGTVTTDTASLTTNSAPPLTQPDPAQALTVTMGSTDFVCDGAPHEFATLSGATPSEQVSFESPETAAIAPGTADANGSLVLQWQCTPEQVGTTWNLTARGVTSGKSALLVFNGVAAGAVAEPSGSSSTDVVSAIAVEVFENPFVCDNTARAFANLSGLSPGATIAFTSPEASDLRAGTAEDDGTLAVRWSCNETQVGMTWNLTATDSVTGESVTFALTGAAAS